MIIVSGVLTLHPGQRDAFLKTTLEVLAAARKSNGCHAFVVAPDPIEPDLAIVYEEWATEEDLLAFRGEGPSPDMKGMIAGANVHQHDIARSKRA